MCVSVCVCVSFFAEQPLAPVRDVIALDQGMSQYVEGCWEEGETKNWASDELAGLLLFCMDKGQAAAVMVHGCGMESL